MKVDVIRVEKFFDEVQCRYRFMILLECDDAPSVSVGEGQCDFKQEEL